MKTIKVVLVNIPMIWKEAKVKLDLEDDKLKEIEKVIMDFINLDRFSYNFRYPTNKSNPIPLKIHINENKDGTKNVLCINLKRLKNNIQLVDELLRFTYEEPNFFR